MFHKATPELQDQDQDHSLQDQDQDEDQDRFLVSDRSCSKTDGLRPSHHWTPDSNSILRDSDLDLDLTVVDSTASLGIWPVKISRRDPELVLLRKTFGESSLAWKKWKNMPVKQKPNAAEGAAT